MKGGCRREHTNSEESTRNIGDVRRVALISYFDPKGTEVGGQRMHLLATYLPRHGWDPYVITAGTGHDTGHVHYVRPLGALDRLWSMTRHQTGIASMVGRISYGQGMAYWIASVYRHICRCHRDVPFDAIVTTSPPESVHVLGQRISHRLHIPWVADLRDLWSQCHTDTPTGTCRACAEAVELRILGNAAALVTVSHGFAGKLGTLHRTRPLVITNGYDPAGVREEQVLDGIFSIVYAGTVYEGQQRPERLFKAVRRCIDAGLIPKNKVRIELYGAIYASVDEAAKKFGLGNIVSQHGFLPRDALYDRMRRAQLLWVMGWEDATQTGVIPAKVFEYLMVRRPILLTGAHEGTDIEKIVKGAGKCASSDDDVARTLAQLYDEYASTGGIAYCANGDVHARFSYECLARRYADVLESLINDNGSTSHRRT